MVNRLYARQVMSTFKIESGIPNVIISLYHGVGNFWLQAIKFFPQRNFIGCC
ncbi:hypothetical protein D3C87_1943120 [compost metagenome]